MSQAAKAQEPSMEEILASIRRIIADDDTKPAARPEAKAPEPKAPPPPPPKPAPAPPPAAAMKQDDIDAMLAGLDEPAAPEPPPPEPEPEPEVLELTEAMQAPASPAFRKIDAEQDVVFEEAPEPEPPRPPPRAPEPQPRMAQPAMPEAAIMSSSTAAAVDSAFNALAHTVLVQNAKTLEDLVKEMLRPMLQHWLDNNLPTLVERLVRQEIERVARGRG
jgi:cell pole-organizing protein PopZ